jgi:hypothetical protein
VALLPSLDNSAVQREWRRGNTGVTSLKVYQCPDDDANLDQNGGLSYSLNAGYAWPACTTTGIPSATQRRAAAVFGFGQSRTYDEINQGDGLENTILFAERHSGLQTWGVVGTTPIPNYPNGTGTNSALLSATNFNGYFAINLSQITPDPCGAPIGTVPNSLDYTPNAADGYTINPEPITSWGTIGINNAAAGGAAPSSLHGDVIIVAFCDGRATSINQNINTHVLMQLITPNGQRMGQGILSQSDY